MLDGATVHTTLPALDMKRAAAFYTEKVGTAAAGGRRGGGFLRPR